jgi:hypothetical protein
MYNFRFCALAASYVEAVPTFQHISLDWAIAMHAKALKQLQHDTTKP